MKEDGDEVQASPIDDAGGARLTVSENSPSAARLSVEVPVDPGVTDVEVSLNAVDVAVETVCMSKLKSFSLANGAVTRVTVGGGLSPASRVTHMLGELVVPEQPLWKPIVAGPPAPTMLYVIENSVPVVGAVVDAPDSTSPR